MADQTTHQDAQPTNTPNASDSTTQVQAQKPTPTGPGLFPTFPYVNSQRRIGDYAYYQRLLEGEHFEAFNIRINDEKYTREYSKLRYVMVNFAGLISKIVADMLFSEPVKFRSPDKAQQQWLDSFVEDNKLHMQNYESAVSNSALGDAIFKLRIDERYENDGKSTIIVEDITPTIFFPEVNGFNVRDEPDNVELAWTFYKGKDKFLRKEIHSAGKITNEIWSMENDKILVKQPLSVLDSEMIDEEDTRIERTLIVHTPNWKTGNRFFGFSDYKDLDKLFYAINNRLTKNDNILDKHGDPILTVPPGVLDEKGNVRKKSLGVIEMGEGETGKPEYIVWDAKLEAAFTQIEKLVDFLLMIGEIAPDALGMGKGTSDTGRALKFKLMRTIAKVARKKLYYDWSLKEVIYRATLLADKWPETTVGDGIKFSGKPFRPELVWADGLPIDEGEQADIEATRLDAGTTTVADSIMRIDGIDADAAEKKAEEIKKETAIKMPQSTLSTPFGPNGPKPDGTIDPTKNKDQKPTGITGAK